MSTDLERCYCNVRDNARWLNDDRRFKLVPVQKAAGKTKLSVHLVYVAKLGLLTWLKRSVGSHTDVDRCVVALTWRNRTAWSMIVGIKKYMYYLARPWAGR
jgi:hypothetical protein